MSQQPAVLPEQLIRYLAERDAQHAEAALNLLTGLTGREYLLVKEAAVMGYVQGMRHPREEAIPKDRQIALIVADAVLAVPDLYPTLTGWVPADDEAAEA
jgi:hypothetical protein